jgi:hypothetical protein
MLRVSRYWFLDIRSLLFMRLRRRLRMILLGGLRGCFIQSCPRTNKARIDLHPCLFVGNLWFCISSIYWRHVKSAEWLFRLYFSTDCAAGNIVYDRSSSHEIREPSTYRGRSTMGWTDYLPYTRDKNGTHRSRDVGAISPIYYAAYIVCSNKSNR